MQKIVFFALSALVAAQASSAQFSDSNSLEASKCNTLSSQGSCAAESSCKWCKSGAVPSACYSDEQAAKLPSGVFVCASDDDMRVALFGALHDDAGAKCRAHGEEGSCDSDDSCTWCKSGAVKSSCYAKEQAMHLPPGVFMCTKQESIAEEMAAMTDAEEEEDIAVTGAVMPEPVADIAVTGAVMPEPVADIAVTSAVMPEEVEAVGAATCHDISTLGQCNANSSCTWCKSGAIPSACWSKEQAARLPPGVFVCGSTLTEASEPACNGAKSESACAAAGGCEWCKSAAVPSSCYTPDQAAKLPSAVFTCAKAQTSYLRHMY